MGLASKMAAANASAGGAPPPSGAPAPAYGAPPGAPSSGYGAPQGAPPQGQYGAPPTPGNHPAYSAPSGGPPPQQQQQGQQGQQQYGQPSQGQQGQQSYGAPSGPPPGSPYGQGQQQQGQQQQGQQQQNQYGAPPGAPPGQAQGSPYGAPQAPYGQSSPSPYGQPPSQQQQQQQPSPYGAPPSAGGPPPGQGPSGAPGGGKLDPRAVENMLQQCVVEQKIHAFYPPGSLGPIAQRVASSGAIEKIAADWKMEKELAMDLVKLSLFDIVILVDDSGSMAFEEGGERIQDLALVLSRVAFAASLFDQDGIQVRFLNNQAQGNNINSEQAALALLDKIKYSGLTPLGTSLEQKVLQPLVLGPARSNSLQKPVLCMILTDGTPAGEPRDKVFQVIINANQELSRSRYGPDAVSYQVAQIGNDLKAQAFLGELDSHPQVGGLVDCTSNYEAEADEMMRKSGLDLTPSLWLVKLLMGGIDDSYDEQDEQR